MKFIAVILSMYIMVLSVLPCHDDHSADDNSACTELSSQNTDHDNDMDLCSPFCFCNCCQTLSFPAESNFLAFNVIKTTLNISFELVSFSSLIVPVWKPPQIFITSYKIHQ